MIPTSVHTQRNLFATKNSSFFDINSNDKNKQVQETLTHFRNNIVIVLNSAPFRSCASQINKSLTSNELHNIYQLEKI